MNALGTSGNSNKIVVELGVTIVDILMVVDSRGRGIKNSIRQVPRIFGLACRHPFKAELHA
jgi:hypothetical protein